MTSQGNGIKVCIMVTSLGIGGAERSSAIISRILTKAGYEVVIISDLDHVVYEFKGRLINLGKIAANKKGMWRRVYRVIFFYTIFKKEKFDYVIDTRSRKSWLKQIAYNKLVFSKTPVVFMVHNYNLRLYFPQIKILAKYLYSKSYKLVGVSTASVRNFQDKYGFKQGICIYNAYDEKLCIEKSKEKVQLPNHKYILSYGRIVDDHKDYTFLVMAYAQSKLPSLGIKLYIIGDGVDKPRIKSLVKKYGIEDFVVFKGFLENPFPYVKNAFFTTLTSNYEGFPMVLVESLAMGTPVVAVDCKSGPSEIIVTGKNGILVPWKSNDKFIEALNKMVTDKDFYEDCLEETISSVTKFKMANISKQWQKILVLRK